MFRIHNCLNFSLLIKLSQGTEVHTGPTILNILKIFIRNIVINLVRSSIT